MPSSQLSSLSEQIEKQDTDHFGKFYMYVALLNTLTVRNKTFTESLPKYERGLAFWKKNHLKIGEIPIQFIEQLNIYSREFINSQPNWSKALQNIVMAYTRKGKISDLAYIIDQMLNHLTVLQGSQSHNQQIYKYIDFEHKKESLAQFIGQVSTFNHHLLSIADNGCNTALSLLAVTTGLVLVLTSVFSIVPLVIGMPLLIIGGYGTYNYLTQSMAQLEQLQNQAKLLEEKLHQLPTDSTIFGDDPNYKSFFASVIKPLPYAAITALEQLATDNSHLEKLYKHRSDIDDAFRLLSI